MTGARKITEIGKQKITEINDRRMADSSVAFQRNTTRQSPRDSMRYPASVV